MHFAERGFGLSSANSGVSVASSLHGQPQHQVNTRDRPRISTKIKYQPSWLAWRKNWNIWLEIAFHLWSLSWNHISFHSYDIIYDLMILWNHMMISCTLKHIWYPKSPYYDIQIHQIMKSYNYDIIKLWYQRDISDDNIIKSYIMMIMISWGTVTKVPLTRNL